MAAQLDIDFVDAVKVPAADTQLGILIRAFKRGERLTVAESLTRYQIYALSQRCGELKRMGWPVIGETIATEGGAHVKRYRLA